jgi:ABC-type antimicrobial peptide transport system permease subunit
MPTMHGLSFDLRDALVGGLLFEVSAHDPIVIAATAVLTGAIGLAACVVAARQGLSLNPAAALREE